MSMNYQAGNTLAVKGELAGIQTKEALFDAGEIIAVKVKIQADIAEAGMAYGSGLTSALLTAMGNNSGTEVESRSYANIPSDKKLYGSVKLEAGTYEIVSANGVVAKIVLIADGNNLKIKPETFYWDGSSSQLTLITTAFDIFIDDNNYMKMYNGSQEFFFYKDASKSSASKVKITSIRKVDTSTRLTKLFTTDASGVMTIKFRVWNIAEDDYIDISLAPQSGSPNRNMTVTAVTKAGTSVQLWSTKVSTSSHLSVFIAVTNQGKVNKWNWLATNGQLSLNYAGTNYLYYTDKAQTNKIECSYLEILNS